MTQETLQMIHEKYNEAAKNSHNVIDILKNLYELLSTEVSPIEKDLDDFDSFLRRIDTSRRIREKSFQMTNLANDICFTIMYIVIWANMTQDLDLDISITARRKSLESELTKLLEKTWDYDRFGIRGIILNHRSDSKEFRSQKLFDANKYVVDILTNRNRKMVNDFTSWLIESAEVETFTRQRVIYAMDLPFNVALTKDYINHPKENGYQSLHTILEMEMYSHILPGAELELQLRDSSMHENAISGSASHDNYKVNSSSYRWVFTLDNPKDLNINGFTGYDSVDNDLDGIHFSKLIYNRRISNSLVLDMKY